MRLKNFAIILALLLAVILTAPLDAASPKLHLILACDTEGENIGYSVARDYHAVRDFFEEYFGKRLNVVDLPMNGLSSEAFFQTIEKLEINSHDTVMFYYSGHGAYNYTKGTQVFTLSNGEYVSRADLMKALRQKEARLTILVSDCCNVVVDIPIAPAQGTRPGGSCPGLTQLFFAEKGELDITSSRIAEVSLCTETTGLFTTYFLEFLKENRTNPNAKWKDMQDYIQPKMTVYFKKVLENENIEYIDLSRLGPILRGLPSKQYDQRMYIYACPNMPLRFGAGVIYDPDQGIVVRGVVPDTPAWRANIGKGDILLEINGSALQQLGDYDILINYSPQDMKLRVRRANGSEENLEVKLAYE